MNSVLWPLVLLALLKASLGIVIPPTSPGEDDVGLVIVQGAYVHPEQYRQLGLAIQNASSSAVWVGIAEGFLDNLPNPLQITSAVDQTLEALRQAGLPAAAEVFLGGHSLGGVMLPYYSGLAETSGVLLLGSYLTSDSLDQFPVPLLHLSGTLDGQTRPTRIAPVYRQLAKMQETDPEAMFRKPVVLVEGVDHAHFFTGQVPSAVAKNDILSEMDASEARQLLAAVCAAFLAQSRDGGDQPSRQVLEDGYNSTGGFLEPLYRLQSLEAEDGGSQWAEQMQISLFNVLNDSLTLDIVSVHEPGLTKLAHQHPKLNVTGDTSGGVSVFSSVEQVFDPLDVSLNAITSSELAVKMVSQAKLQAALPAGRLGAPVSCQQLSQQALQQALLAAPLSARQRYDRRGLPVTFQPDHTASAGPLWLAERLRLDYQSSGLVVQSVALITKPDGIIFPGVHYCKLLTPSRALEYILTDGLRGTQP